MASGTRTFRQLAYFIVTYGDENDPLRFILVAKDYYNALYLCQTHVEDVLDVEEVVKTGISDIGDPIFEPPTYH